MNKDLVVSVAKQASRLFKEGNCGPETVAAILNATARLQAAEEIAKALYTVNESLIGINMTLQCK